MSERAMLRIPKSAAPVPTATRLANRRVPVRLYLGGAAALILALVAGSIGLGWYSTSGRVDSDGRAVTLTAASSSEDIKGWMTIAQVLDAYAIPKDLFYATFGIPAGVATDATLGPLGEEVPGFELEQVRTWLDARTAGTVTTAGTGAATVETRDATPIARASSGTATSQATTSPSATSTSTAKPSPSPTATRGTTDGEPQVVRGTTTLDEFVALAGTTRAILEERFGIKASLPGSTTLSSLDDAVSVPDLRAWLAGS